MAKRKIVMVVHPISDSQASTLRGVSDFARERGNWVLHFNPEMTSLRLNQLRGWPGDGMIGLLRTVADLSGAKALKLPVVNVSGAIQRSTVPRVMMDQQMIGRLAAEHLLDCGFRRFAYYGELDMWYSVQRKRGFIERLHEAGRQCKVLETKTHFGEKNPWYTWIETIERWLRTLELPVGLFAVHDFAASMIVHTCANVRLRIPDDIGVVGSGNNPGTCDFCEVPLSSVARQDRELGYQAASLLDRMMNGRKARATEILIPPAGIVQRRSTEVLVTEDTRVRKAVRFVQSHLSQPLSVQAIWRSLGVSPRTLDICFKKGLGCSPREYLSRTRIKEARRLLSQADQPKMQRIARDCGYGSLRQFYTAFRNRVGMTPTEFSRHVRRDK